MEHFIAHENVYKAPLKLFENRAKHIIKVALYLLNPSPVQDAWLPVSFPTSRGKRTNQQLQGRAAPI